MVQEAAGNGGPRPPRPFAFPGLAWEGAVQTAARSICLLLLGRTPGLLGTPGIFMHFIIFSNFSGWETEVSDGLVRINHPHPSFLNLSGNRPGHRPLSLQPCAGLGAGGWLISARLVLL